MRERKDFANVRLSAAGRAFAGSGETLRVVGLRMNYVFAGDAATEVLRYAELPELLKHCDAEGAALLEVVETPAPSADEHQEA